MATKPTRHQQQACDLLAGALYAITEAYHLDGHGALESGDLDDLAKKLARISSGFPLDQIVLRAIERRARALNLSSSAVDLITLAEDDVKPLQTLRLTNQDFIQLVEKLEQELGGL